MAQISLQPTEKSSVMVSKKEKVSRLFFVDHLRAALAILVVLHHIALVYGAGAPFYYVEPPMTDPLAFKVLLIFILFNQAWFMGAFFLLAGYFTPGSFDRKGAGAFLRGRLLRLGIPLLLFYFVLSPIASTGFWQMPAALTGITSELTWETFWQAYPALVGLGPIWFVAMLLIFNVGYVVWRAATGNRTTSSDINSSLPGYLSIAVFVVGLALVSYLLRMVVPLGREVFGFPTLAYLPQYLSFFVLGIIASRGDWFRRLPGTMGAIGLVVALAAAVFLFSPAFSGRLFSLELTEVLDNAMGNGHWQSAVYALWDSAFAVGLVLAFIPLFRRFLGGQSRFGSFLSQQSYGVYIFHIPIIVLIAVLLKDVVLAPLPKFGLAAVIIVPLCFIIAYLLRKVPGVSKVL